MVNAALSQAVLEKVSAPDADGQKLLIQAAETLGLTARGYHRVLRVARTLERELDFWSTRPNLGALTG